MTSTVAAVLFDVDGTLVDHQSASDAAVVEMLQACPTSSPVGLKRVISRWNELQDWAMERYLAGELTFAEQRRVRVKRFVGELGTGTWSDRQADAWFSRYLDRYEAAWDVYEDVPPALAALTAEHAGLRLGVITNGDADQQRRKLRRTGLADLLDHFTASSEAGVAKPDPRIFVTACTRLGLCADQVVYVGDRLGTDTEAAIAAGLRGVWLDRERGTVSTSVPRVESLTSLLPLLNRLPGKDS
ncbi:HAD family hydrolase [Streptomyces sp. NPDC001351]|uniref:HAD family hydrolase n=1 Tax=Streptomyces sp. NPDC001351 TaxID=3364564 RepID=UPI00368356C4